MTILAVVGDCTTTTCVALAATWPIRDETIVIEADRRGGSLAGWLDTPASPSLTTVVSSVGSSPSTPMATITAMAHRSASGLRFVAAPLRSLPARRAVEESATAVVPALARTATVAIADVGAEHHDSPFVRSAAIVVMVHRQASASAGAAAVRLERLIESIEHLAGSGLVLAVVGERPFDPPEIATHIETAVPGALLATMELAEDPLAAEVIAGRAGVSARRLRRLPLMRSAAQVAAQLSAQLGSAGGSGVGARVHDGAGA